MLEFVKKHVLTTISILSIFFITIACAIYIINFWTVPISDDPAVWGTFGDYVGGIINTILSLSSLIILGVLTHNISKQSSEENKNINLLMRKMDSYDKLAFFSTEIFTAIQIMTAKGLKLNSPVITIEMVNSIKAELENDIKIFMEFYSLLVTFEKRYGYLYRYDFSSDEFEDLINEAESLNGSIDNLINSTLNDPKELLLSTTLHKLHAILGKLEMELK